MRNENFEVEIMKRRAFTLIELLVVVAIIALLAAILFPAFATVRGRARQTACLSNLKQIASAVQMYGQDYDGRFPYAIDPSDRITPSIWASYPGFQAEIARLPYLQDTLVPYIKSPALFRCPGDIGFTINDFTGQDLQALPTSFEKYGTSYYYRTEFAAAQIPESAIETPEKINMIFDGVGRWHGTLIRRERRYNVLFADGHVKNIGAAQIDEAWATPIGTN